MPTKIMRALIPTIVLLATLTACSSAGPPHGPKYKPSASEESATPCPKERAKAKLARENLLGSTKPLLQKRAGELVFAHAKCEESAAYALETPKGSGDEIIAGLRRSREQTQNALNLYKEIRQYGQPMLLIAALIAQGRLQIALAKNATSTLAPTDLDVTQRAEFQGELALAANVLRQEAVLLLEEGLLLAGNVEEAQFARQEACELLRSISNPSPSCTL